MSALSKEDEERIAKEKKERMDDIKKKYSGVGKQARSRSKGRRIVSAKDKAQSEITAQLSELNQPTSQLTSEGLKKFN